MPTKVEMLNLGLHDAQDRIFAPEGGLLDAKNARYKPNDAAIWHAEGRQVVADGTHSVKEEISAFVGLQWDPGTEAGARAGITRGAQLQQILYVKGENELRSIVASANPADQAMNSGQSLGYSLPSGVTIGPDALVAIGIDNSHVFLSGGENGVMIRSTGAAQRVQRHGLPAQNLAINPGDAAAAGNWNAAAGRHFFAFSWYDSTNNIESEITTLGVSGDLRGSAGSTATITGAVTYSAAQTNITTDITVKKSDFDPVVPSQVDSIRLYKSVAKSLWDIKPWPFLYWIKDIAFLANTDGNRFADFSFTGSSRYLIYTFGDSSHTDPTDDAIDTNLAVPDLSLAYGQVSVAGAATTFYSMRGKPPRASTGDVFQESLVLNDLDDPRKIRYSSPDLGVHAFPTIWFVNFETAQTDQVKAIRTLGNRLGVFLTNSIHRVNWLPTQADFDFQRGRVTDVVTEGLGVNNHYGVAKFQMPGKGPMLAFVDITGVYITDLYSTQKISQNMDWSRVKNVRNATLIDDPNNERLVLKGGDEMWFFHYDQSHLGGGAPAITGPITRTTGISAINTVVTSGGKTQLLSTDFGSGSLFYEGFGFEGSLLVTTREIYPFGVGNEGQIQRAYMHLKPSNDGAGQLAVRLKAGTADRETFHDNIPDQPLQQRRLRPFTMMALAEYYFMQFILTSGQSANAVNFVGVDSESLGEAESTVPFGAAQSILPASHR